MCLNNNHDFAINMTIFLSAKYQTSVLHVIHLILCQLSHQHLFVLLLILNSMYLVLKVNSIILQYS